MPLGRNSELMNQLSPLTHVCWGQVWCGNLEDEPDAAFHVLGVRSTHREGMTTEFGGDF